MSDLLPELPRIMPPPMRRDELTDDDREPLPLLDEREVATFKEQMAMNHPEPLKPMTSEEFRKLYVDWSSAEKDWEREYRIDLALQDREQLREILTELLATATFESARSIDTLTRAERLLKGA